MSAGDKHVRSASCSGHVGHRVRASEMFLEGTLAEQQRGVCTAPTLPSCSADVDTSETH